jgi:hypothetical protein
VLDASVALARCFADEASRQAQPVCPAAGRAQPVERDPRDDGRSGNRPWFDRIHSIAETPLRQVELVGLLQIEPDSRACPEPATQAKRGIGRDIALARQNLADPVGWEVDQASQLGSTRA